MKKTTTETKPKATAAGVPVYCANDAIIRAADLKPNPKNPLGARRKRTRPTSGRNS